MSDLSLRAASHALQSSIDFLFLSRDSPAPDLSHRDICIYAFILLLQSYIICTALRPRLISFFSLMYQPHGIRSPSLFLLPFMYHIHGLMCFLSRLCIMSSIQHLIMEVRADGYKTPNFHIVACSLVLVLDSLNAYCYQSIFYSLPPYTCMK